LLPDLLARLASRLNGRVALVSGRGAQEVAALIDVPGLTIAGSHGAEILSASGRLLAPLAPPFWTRLWPRSTPLQRGIPACWWRTSRKVLPCTTAACPGRRRPARPWPPIWPGGSACVSSRARWSWNCSPGHDKGTAIRRLMQQAAMIATRPVFIGDDHTDEAGFRAVAAMDGAGILVGPLRDTAAIHQLPTVASVHAWLDEEVKA
jgi:trehalose 6-phosphate phosphatase